MFDKAEQADRHVARHDLEQWQAELAEKQTGIDALIGVDPVQGTHTDMPRMKEALGGRVCLWGGVSGAVTVERGTDEEVRAAVRHAVETLGPTGFILSPVDNITVDDPRTWHNVDVFIDEWRKQW